MKYLQGRGASRAGHADAKKSSFRLSSSDFDSLGQMSEKVGGNQDKIRMLEDEIKDFYRITCSADENYMEPEIEKC